MCLCSYRFVDVEFDLLSGGGCCRYAGCIVVAYLCTGMVAGYRIRARLDLLVGYARAFSGVFVRNGLQCKCYLFLFGDSPVFGNGNHSSAVQKTKEQMDGYLGKIFGCLGYCIASWICHFASGFQKLL